MNYDPQVRAAYEHFYNLDYPGAVARFEQFHAAHPGDPQATAYLLDALIFEELYRQDLLDTTFYANDGFLTGRHATEEDPAKRNQIFALADEAVREADWRLSKNPNDVDALFARAWVRSLRCTYVAMVERGFATGFRLATKAKDDAERALQLDPDYVDAKLIVGRLRVCGRRAPLAVQADDRLCRHHRLQSPPARACCATRAIAASSPALRRAPPSRSSSAARQSIAKPSTWCAA